MKILKKAIIVIVSIISTLFFSYYFTDIFYPQTKIELTDGKAEILISRLITKDELENIKSKLYEKGIKLDIVSVTFSGCRIKDISVHVTTSFGEGNFSTGYMRFLRHFSILIDMPAKSLYLGRL